MLVIKTQSPPSGCLPLVGRQISNEAIATSGCYGSTWASGKASWKKGWQAGIQGETGFISMRVGKGYSRQVKEKSCLRNWISWVGQECSTWWGKWWEARLEK